MHGKKSLISQVFNSDYIYKGVPANFFVGRYHSWGIKLKHENKLLITSRDSQECIMSFRHQKNNIIGIQYHPESILTKYGELIIRNWLNN